MIVCSTGKNIPISKAYCEGHPAAMAELLLVLPIMITTDEGDLVYKEIPPRVEYQPTETGKSLMPILYAMADWGNSEIAKELIVTEK